MNPADMTNEQILEALKETDPALAATLAAELELLEQAHARGERDARPRIKVTTRFKLEKFDGEGTAGEPVEVIEGGDDLPTTRQVLPIPHRTTD